MESLKKEIEELSKPILSGRAYAKLMGKKHKSWFTIAWSFVLKFLQKLVGYCPRHSHPLHPSTWFEYPKHYHRNTAYVDMKLNYGYMPKCCQDEEYEMYEEMWRDYYNGCL